MILYEYEGKKLLKDAGITVPESQLIDSIASLQNDIQVPCVLKAQVLSGKRADVGGIIKVKSEKGKVKSLLEELFGKTINNEKVEKVLVEEMVEFAGSEYYISISYDTETRGPILTISEKGGTGVEERNVETFSIDPITQSVILSETKNISFAGAQDDNLKTVIDKLIKLFFEQDLLLLEINPLVRSKEMSPSTTPASGVAWLRTKQSWIALDAKIKLEDNAIGRHKDWEFPPRSAPGHTPTQNEIEAKKIDEGDYRGVAGSTYFDLDGDIAILASGGGASLTAMDALQKCGGNPANYTEYGGNPPREKVERLTRVVLDKPGIHGLWVVGAVANFTDIYETLSGFVEGLRNLRKSGMKIDFPIVIRRGGPRDKEAFEMLKKVKDFDLHLYGEETSITESAKTMADLALDYSKSN
ncbi:hypothetical protein A3B39_00740 [Candidatus Daviesbacteria bacterium RIFCSPLOWO2_01_FULL_37_10]|nr:MAG: hypothetical protein A3B39_00740 [Candidatus Daviesbacteria bacterium RIFCSPLOWO2_01_FULL_37_10]